ncbi:hypothetical protein [Brucella anthropi]|uniref:hypothetical protein n=1 Tax=Brucella anthropi TaxID=529 RepID=UPI00384A7EAE
MNSTDTHPITGVKLNPIPIERKSLSFDDAVTAFVMKKQKIKYAVIAHRLGTNTFRLGEVFTGKEHFGAEEEADRLLNGSSH